MFIIRYKIIPNIPNAITCVNLLAGCMAIAMSAHGTELIWSMKAYQWAFIFIAIGAVADFLDGFAARALQAYSKVGKELDSLSDLVTFGVAPAMIIINLFLQGGNYPWVAWTALLIPLTGAVRLARFNIDTRQATTFIGMPIPANAIFWIGYIAIFEQHGYPELSNWFWFIPVMLIECWYMISPVRMFSLKFKNLKFKDNLTRYLLIIGTVICCCILGVGGLLWAIVLYILLSLATETRPL